MGFLRADNRLPRRPPKVNSLDVTRASPRVDLSKLKALRTRAGPSLFTPVRAYPRPAAQRGESVRQSEVCQLAELGQVGGAAGLGIE